MLEGVDGLLRDKTRPSRIPPLGPEIAERVVALTLADPSARPPPGRPPPWQGPAGSAPVRCDASGAHGLQPHRVRRFKLSKDPQFAAKLCDIVGLYVDPPAHAVVLSVDEKSQICPPRFRARSGTPRRRRRARGDRTGHGGDHLGAGRCRWRHRGVCPQGRERSPRTDQVGIAGVDTAANRRRSFQPYLGVAPSARTTFHGDQRLGLAADASRAAPELTSIAAGVAMPHRPRREEARVWFARRHPRRCRRPTYNPTLSAALSGKSEPRRSIRAAPAGLRWPDWAMMAASGTPAQAAKVAKPARTKGPLRVPRSPFWQ